MRELFGRWEFFSKSLTFRDVRGRYRGRGKRSEQRLAPHREAAESESYEPPNPQRASRTT